MTRREEIIVFLEQHEASIQDLAERFDTTRQTIANDLAHIFKSLKYTHKSLLVRPARCLNPECEYVFSAKRKRLADPQRCPKCRLERIDPQVFKIISD